MTRKVERGQPRVPMVEGVIYLSIYLFYCLRPNFLSLEEHVA